MSDITHEYRGVTFSCTKQLVEDVVIQYGLDIFNLSHNAIDHFLLVSNKDVGDFSIKFEFDKKRLVAKGEITYEMKVLKVDKYT